MTSKQKQMLLDIAGGTDPNDLAQVARLLGGKHEHAHARTMLALYRAGMLRIRDGGGLEITDAGRAKAAKLGGAA